MRSRYLSSERVVSQSAAMVTEHESHLAMQPVQLSGGRADTTARRPFFTPAGNKACAYVAHKLRGFLRNPKQSVAGNVRHAWHSHTRRTYRSGKALGLSSGRLFG